jgi:hypothetical protein
MNSHIEESGIPNSVILIENKNTENQNIPPTSKNEETNIKYIILT